MKSKSQGVLLMSFAGFLTLSASCKSGSPMGGESVSEILTTDGSDPVVIVLGGFWSCGSETMSKNKADWSPMETRGSAGSMFTIATRQIQTIKNAVKGDFGVVSSCYYPEVDISGINYINNLSGSKSVVRTDLDQMILAINGSLEKLKNPKVSLIGHSYGGWTAMKVAQNLTPKATLNTLVTIDAISRKNCHPREFVKALEKGQPFSGCAEAPSDFNTQEIEAIAKRANGSWYNYYQTSAVMLHSSAFNSAAVKNEEVKYTPKDPKVESHILFLKDDQFINKMTQTVVQNMSK